MHSQISCYWTWNSLKKIQSHLKSLVNLWFIKLLQNLVLFKISVLFLENLSTRIQSLLFLQRLHHYQTHSQAFHDATKLFPMKNKSLSPFGSLTSTAGIYFSNHSFLLLNPNKASWKYFISWTYSGLIQSSRDSNFH